MYSLNGGEMANKHGEDEEIALFKKKQNPKTRFWSEHAQHTRPHAGTWGGGGHFHPDVLT